MRKGISPGVILGGVAVVLALTGTAVADSLITSDKIKDGTVQSRDVKKGTLKRDRLSADVVASLAKADRSGTTVQGAPLAGSPGSIGPKGDAGATGANGAAGATGAKGATGATGAAGPAGLAGAKGDTGAKGLDGAAGAKGEKGDKGDTGSTGLKGDKGDTGSAGLKGDKGDKGDTGPAGSPGASLVHNVPDEGVHQFLAKIGGPIKTGVTPLTTAVTLQPGTYLVSANGVFYRTSDDLAAPDTYGVLVLWLDKNDDGVYDWQNGEGKGTAFTPAIPQNHKREASTSETHVIVITTPTKLLLGGFGYNSDESGYGSDDRFSVVPSLSVVKLNG